MVCTSTFYSVTVICQSKRQNHRFLQPATKSSLAILSFRSACEWKITDFPLLATLANFTRHALTLHRSSQTSCLYCLRLRGCKSILASSLTCFNKLAARIDLHPRNRKPYRHEVSSGLNRIREVCGFDANKFTDCATRTNKYDYCAEKHVGGAFSQIFKASH